jgi:hypothetical protein
MSIGSRYKAGSDDEQNRHAPVSETNIQTAHIDFSMQDTAARLLLFASIGLDQAAEGD